MKFALGAYQPRVDAHVGMLLADDAVSRIWRRDATFWGGDAARQRSVANRLGWLDVASQMHERVAEIVAFASHVKAEGFTNVVLLGMGGSSLAPEVLRQSIAERAQGGGLTLHVLDTTDPATILAVSGIVDPARTLFFVSSKSGTTIEALSLFAFFHEMVEQVKPGHAGANFVAVTDAGTPLEALAREHGFRHVFTNPGDIGGRYSALSYFGLAPAAVAGVDVDRLLNRGIAASDSAREATSDALRLGAALGELALAGRDKCTFIVSQEIASFGLWVEQLIAESTGKEGRGILPVASEPPGEPEAYGPDRVFVQLRLAGANNATDDALVAALVSRAHPTIVIDLEDAYALGRAFFSWEFAIAVAGQVLGINPFDEPNVQESKDNTNRVLKEFEATGKLTLDCVHPDAERAAPAVRAFLTEVRSRSYFAITAYLEPIAHSDEEFGHMRRAVRDRFHIATTLGYGPRFLHSTGQLHKGGPPTGGFLQVIGEYANDIAIPGRPFTFGQLKRAQAIGDRESLIGHGLPVLSVDVGKDHLDLEALCGEVANGVDEVVRGS